MAGSDQSVNLSGMLGQIAETTGSMGSAYDPVLKAATKPRGDMNDPQHLRNLAQWASSNGDSTMAAQYMQEARRIDGERKAANEKVVKEAKDRAVNTAVSAYDAALRSGDPDKIQAAYEEATRVGNDTGRTTITALSQLEGAQRQRDEQAYRDEQRQRTAAEENFVTAFNQAIDSTMTAEQIQKKIDAAPAMYKDQARTIGQRQIQFNDQVAKDKERKADLATPVSTDFAASSVKAIKNDEVRANFEERLATLEEPEGWDGETWATSAQRRRYQTQVNELASAAFNTGTREILDTSRSERERQDQIANGAAVVSRQPISKSDMDAYATANGIQIKEDNPWNIFDRDANNMTYEEVKNAIRQERMDGYYAGLGLDNPNKDTELTDEELLDKYPTG